MSQTRGDELKDNVVRGKADEYEELQEQYANDEISEAEFEARVHQLLDNGDEFLDYEETAADAARDTGRSLKKKLTYYSLPLTVIGTFAAVILLPNVSPMVAIVAAPTILTVALLIWGYFKLRSLTSDW